MNPLINITPGTLVELSFKNESNELIQFKTKVERYTEKHQIALYTPLSKGLRQTLPQDQSINLLFIIKAPGQRQVTYYSVKGLYHHSFQQDNDRIDVFNLMGDLVETQRRNFFRVSILRSAMLLPDQQIMLVDLSLGGAKVISSIYYKEGTELRLQIPDDGLGTFNSTVIACESLPDNRRDYSLRLAFNHENPSSESNLNSFLLREQMIQRQKNQATETEFDSLIMDSPVIERKAFFRTIKIAMTLATFCLTSLGAIVLSQGMPVQNPIIFQTLLGIKPLHPTWDLNLLKLAKITSLLAVGTGVINLLIHWPKNKKTSLPLVFNGLLILINLCIWVYSGLHQ